MDIKIISIISAIFGVVFLSTRMACHRVISWGINQGEIPFQNEAPKVRYFLEEWYCPFQSGLPP
jgi:hypothetical protein